MKKPILLSTFLILTLLACKDEPPARLTAGQKITASVTLEPDTLRLNAVGDKPALTIEGENLVIDFGGTVLIGSDSLAQPDSFTGTGILISGKNITLKNATVRGFKVAVFAEGVDSLQLLDCDLSYNYRQRLKSGREREHLDDWLSYHQNDQDEWLRYGAAAYLKNCNHALVRNLTVTGGQNGLMLTGCNDGLFYNNRIQFNSGIGIGLYRSSRNRVMHNRLDWNVRGYSHGFYARGQDSAGILCYEQSSENTFAYNSATHSGDGFFLWAGQSTMDTGEGGCNDNLIYKNDFSYAPTNGVEVTFSRSQVVGNKLVGCKYGIWGGYSFGSFFGKNEIEDCRFGIAIEHGQDNAIYGNKFRNDTIGIQLFEREKQPDDWGYSKNRDVASRGYLIQNNSFQNVILPLKISSTQDVEICKGNRFNGFEKKLTEEKPNENLKDRSTACLPADSVFVFQPPEKLPDAQPDRLGAGHLQGRQYIFVDEWGPYDFQSPSVWLRAVDGDKHTFLLLGPATGNYKITGGEGWKKLNRVSGAFPATLIATAKPDAELLTLECEFIGQAFTDRFGRLNPKGEVFKFRFQLGEEVVERERVSE